MKYATPDINQKLVMTVTRTADYACGIHHILQCQKMQHNVVMITKQALVQPCKFWNFSNLIMLPYIKFAATIKWETDTSMQLKSSAWDHNTYKLKQLVLLQTLTSNQRYIQENQK